MLTSEISFKVGDQVIHWVHGYGEITEVDNKIIAGQTRLYFEVQLRNLTLYLPVDENIGKFLRYPTPAGNFDNLFQILKSPGQPLPADRFERQTYLLGKLSEGNLESVCAVIRDLSSQKQVAKMNESDHSILSRARATLLNEWSGVLSVPVELAEIELNGLLKK